MFLHILGVLSAIIMGLAVIGHIIMPKKPSDRLAGVLLDGSIFIYIILSLIIWG